MVIRRWTQPVRQKHNATASQGLAQRDRQAQSGQGAGSVESSCLRDMKTDRGAGGHKPSKGAEMSGRSIVGRGPTA